MSNSVIEISIDDNLKSKATETFNNIGIDISDAIKMFLNESILINGLPFDVNDGNNKTITKDYLNRFIYIDKPIYNKKSVNEYLNESRRERYM